MFLCLRTIAVLQKASLPKTGWLVTLGAFQGNIPDSKSANLTSPKVDLLKLFSNCDPPHLPPSPPPPPHHQRVAGILMQGTNQTRDFPSTTYLSQISRKISFKGPVSQMKCGRDGSRKSYENCTETFKRSEGNIWKSIDRHKALVCWNLIFDHTTKELLSAGGREVEFDVCQNWEQLFPAPLKVAATGTKYATNS